MYLFSPYYYVEIRNTTTGCLSTSRVKVTAFVNEIPDFSVLTANNGNRCGAGTVSISVSNVPTGTTIDWFEASSGGVALLSGNSAYTTISINDTTDYYAEIRNTTSGCVGTSRVKVVPKVMPVPV